MAIERSKKFSIGKKQFIARFPNVGQLIDMESLKQALTNNRYGQMAASGIASMYTALDLVDAIAFYSVVTPEVGKYYDIRNYADMELDKAQDLLHVYTEEIRPWFVGVMEALKSIQPDGGTGEKKSGDGRGTESMDEGKA